MSGCLRIGQVSSYHVMIVQDNLGKAMLGYIKSGYDKFG